MGQCKVNKGIWGAMALIQAREEGVHNNQILDIYHDFLNELCMKGIKYKIQHWGIQSSANPV